METRLVSVGVALMAINEPARETKDGPIARHGTTPDIAERAVEFCCVRSNRGENSRACPSSIEGRVELACQSHAGRRRDPKHRAPRRGRGRGHRLKRAASMSRRKTRSKHNRAPGTPFVPSQALAAAAAF